MNMNSVKKGAGMKTAVVLIAVLMSVVAMGFTCQVAHAVVWCHDYTIHTITGQDVDNTRPDVLRALLTNLGYKPFSYSAARFSSVAGTRLKEGDVLVIGDSHSGVVNKSGTIDHFIQIEGKSGTHYNPADEAFQKLVRRNNTLEQFLNRPVYQKMPLEIWRYYKRAELVFPKDFPLFGRKPWTSGDFLFNPKAGTFSGTFVNRSLNRLIGNKAVLYVQGTVDTEGKYLQADYSGSALLAESQGEQRENRFSGVLSLTIAADTIPINYRGNSGLSFSRSESGYEIGKKYSGITDLHIFEKGTIGRSVAESERSNPSTDKSGMGCLDIFTITADGKSLYQSQVGVTSGNTHKEGPTDYTGFINFSLPAGVVSISAEGPAGLMLKPASRTVKIRPGDCEDVFLVMKPEGAPQTEDSGRLTVRVMDEEGWYAGANVGVIGISAHNYTTTVRTKTGPDGYAVIMDPLPPGTYQVIAGGAGHGIDQEAIAISAGEEASLVLLVPYKLQPLTVGVLDKKTKRPIPGARVEFDLGASTLTNAQGVADFKGVPVGKRKGKVAAPGYRTVEFTVQIEERIDYVTSTTVYLEGGQAVEGPGAVPATTDRERRALQDDLARWEKILECLEEGKRKYPNYWQDCNGNFTMRDRDVKIAHYRNLIKNARTKLGQSPSGVPAVSPAMPLPSDRIALTTLTGADVSRIGKGKDERRLQNGDQLTSGTTLRTGKQSSASFRTSGETQVTLQPNTQVQVVQKPKDKGPVWQVQLSSGAIDVTHRESAPSYDDVNVISRDGSITPLNTRYRVEVTPTGTLVEVFQGKVRLNGAQILRLNTAGKPSPVTSLDLRGGERAIMLKTAGAAAEKPGAANLLVNGGFEQGLVKPWESGFFSKDGAIWFNSGNCQATAEIDRQTFHSGSASLHLRNASRRSPNVYGTMSQKINVSRNRDYTVSLWAKGQNVVSYGALNVAVDPMWRVRPLAVPAGTYGWTRLSGKFNSGDRDSMEIRIIFEDMGDIWLDDLRVEEQI